jgi:Tol biopolymer transport system component/predicted Ser/Thr protein kinase
MTPERWRQVTDLFHAALSRDRRNRAVFLSEACAADAALRAEVDAMLAAHAQAGSSGHGSDNPSPTELPRLPAGTLVGPYRLDRAIGAGGMGVVYRAHDPRVGRDVAIKMLPPQFIADAERLRRFEHEARAVGALNHPNLLTLYDVGTTRDQPYLVMEFIDGETLRTLLESGPLPSRRACEVAIEIARGLAAAHSRNIVHRDLKPDNVMVTRDGRVKILDFGIAKLRQPAAVGAPPEAMPPQTGPEIILGTVGYMAPEQIRGDAVDGRADLFAVGAILFELLTGRHAFEGRSPADVLHAILYGDRTELSLPASVSPTLDVIVRRCLAADPDMRFQTARDLTFALELAIGGPGIGKLEAIAPPGSRFTLRRLADRQAMVALVIGASLASVAFWLSWNAERSGATLRASIVAPPGVTIAPPMQRSPLAISPDGTRIVFVGIRDGVRLLYTRAIGALQAVPIPATEGADSPVFSPDGRWIAFHAAGALRRISVTGGAPQTVASAGNMRGAAWTRDDQLVFARSFFAGLAGVPSSGGALRTLTTVDLAKGEKSHRFPHSLPEGTHLLFTVVPSDVVSNDDARIAVLSLETGQASPVLTGGTFPRYVGAGYLVYARAGSLLAAPFDLSRMAVTGTPVPVVDHVWMSPAFGSAAYDVSSDGSLVYLPSPDRGATWRVVLVDPGGTSETLLETSKPLEYVSASPDGRYLALEESAANDIIWLYDMSRKNMTRLNLPPGDAEAPVWTPDGKSVTYCVTTPPGLMSASADRSAPPERVTSREMECWHSTWSPDRGHLLFAENTPAGGQDILAVRVGAGGSVVPVLNTAFIESQPRVSPNGRWLAFTSNESGRTEIYVQRFPEASGKWLVSTDGGTAPRWSADGTELFYRHGTKVLSVAVDAGTVFKAGAARVVVDGPFDDEYDVMPDGRFVMIQSQAVEPATRLTLVVNWFEELRRLVARQR